MNYRSFRLMIYFVVGLLFGISTGLLLNWVGSM
jgi:hypothetical protein